MGMRLSGDMGDLLVSEEKWGAILLFARRNGWEPRGIGSAKDVMRRADILADGGYFYGTDFFITDADAKELGATLARCAEDADGHRARLVKQWRHRTRLVAMAAGIDLDTLPRQCRISYTVRRARRCDDDNLRGSGALKAVRDQLFPDDRQVVQGDVVQEVGPAYRLRPEVVVTVEPYD